MIFIGIDPGASGGIALLSDDGLIGAVPMPDTERDLYEFLSDPFLVKIPDVAERRHIKAVIERVHSSPQMGVASSFAFGRNYGGLRMALIASGIPFDEVTPNTWQAFMGVRNKTGRREIRNVDATAKKNAHKARAQQLFPQVKVTHAIADALLIAEYARRMERGVTVHDDPAPTRYLQGFK